MIYTITTNPSLDYYLNLDELKTGTMNRSELENYDAAGKGVNVSKFLDKLKINSVALGFLGGFTKEFYISLLCKYKHIQPQFTSIRDNTRINIKIKAKEETSLNAKGPNITEEEFNKFMSRTTQIFDNDYVVFSGNIQDNLSDTIVSTIKNLINSNVRVILDTDNKIVEKACGFKPYLIKMDDLDIDMNEENIISTGKKYIEMGVNYFLFSSAHSASYLFEDGCYYKCEHLKETHKTSTGTNDGMIAGILWSKLKGANSLEAFTYGNAVSAGVSLLDEVADFKVINDLYDSIKIERVKF